MATITIGLTDAAEALEERRQEYERILEEQRKAAIARHIPRLAAAIECAAGGNPLGGMTLAARQDTNIGQQNGRGKE